jgi:protein-disulfide isomerase-like protein with CxxC motif
VVRDKFPDRFLAVQRALFDVRHVDGKDLREADVIGTVLEDNGVDARTVVQEIEAGWPRVTFRKAHTDAVESASVFGVPTFIAGDAAVFVRLMEGPNGDADLARRTVDRILDTITGWPTLNEFKHTSIAR